MTEDEALTKACPIYGIGVALMGATGVIGAVLGATDGAAQKVIRAESGKCIGSACMMFRKRTLTAQEQLGVQERATADMALAMMSECYCGLAGKP